MRIIRWLGIVLLGSWLLSGCSLNPAQPETSSPAPQPLAEPAPPVREVPLSAELLYQILIAEFAAQQGELHLAAQAYLQTAITSRDARLANRATRMAVYSRDLNLALQAAELWAELAPEQLEARQSLAALLLRHGQADAAVAHMQQVITLAPQGPGQGFMIISNLLSQENDRQLAMQIMEQLVAQYPDEPLAHYAHAHLASQLGENELALLVLDRLLAQSPRMLDARVLQGRVHHAMGNQAEALESILRALRQQPDNHQMRMIYARMLVDAQQLEEARRQFRILVKNQPDDSDIVYALALLAMELGDLDEAESSFLQLLKLGERSDEARIALGQLAEQRQQGNEAIEWYRSISPNSERYMDAQLQAAQLIFRQQGLTAALSFLRGLSLHSQEDIAQRYLGEAELLAAGGQLEQAMEVYDEGVALFLNHPELRYGRALLAEKLDRLEQLEQDLRRILASNPEHVHALNALGYTLVDRTARVEEGFDYIQRAYQLSPSDPAILDSMGWAYFRLGQLNEALSYLRQGYAIMPDAEIAAHLGEVLWTMGQHEEALQIWRKAEQQDPEHRVLRETLQRLAP
ncbi:MAG: tetratricopeptide repeat protein [Gammaproteobacteria bacterium]|nr:tetratricopeptide repeat protein [Gammaproteobacteria bacterium]